MSVVNQCGAILVLLIWPIICPEVLLAQPLSPPIARRAPASIQAHGKTLVDPYPWMDRERDPEAIAYLEAENRYTSAAMANTQRIQEKLYREMRSRMDETDPQPPLRIGSDWYYLRSAAGSQFLLLCRRRGSLKAQEEVLVDLNQMAGGEKKPNFGVWRLSPNRRCLAYSVDTDGSEDFTIHFRGLDGETTPAETISGAGRWIEWAADSETLFYTTPGYGKPPPRYVMRHRVGRPEARDEVVYSESSSRLALTRTRTGEFLLLLVYGPEWEMRFLAANQPSGTFQIVGPRRKGVQYQVEQQGNFFYILVNEPGENAHVVRAPVSGTVRSAWEEIVPARPDRDIESFAVVGSELILAVRQDGQQRITTCNLRTRTETDVQFSDPLGSYGIPSNLDRLFPTWPTPGANAIHLLSESFTNPRSVFEYDLKRKALNLLWQSHVPGYRPRLYESRRVFATAPDGTGIPISLVFKKPLVRDGQRPILLFAYGSMGVSVDPWFDAERVSLLDRGVVFAVAHVRGGGELGRPWHQAAMGRTKLVSFTDFIASAEHLIAERYTSRGKLAITGTSAGGLLVGGAANMRPDLFQAVIAKSPMVQLFFPATGRLGTMGPDFGDAREKADFDTMYAYSPYDNVRAQAYPHMLFTASQADPRTGSSPAAKFVARLRAAETGKHMLLLKVEMESGGHMGAAGRLDRLRETAFDYAFLFEALGITR
jgi:oligopeptidase B